MFYLAHLLLRSDDDTFFVSDVESAVQYTRYRKVIQLHLSNLITLSKVVMSIISVSNYFFLINSELCQS